MRHQPQTEHLKADAPLWRRLFRPSMPEWTPMKIAVAFVLVAFFISVGLAFQPGKIRSFVAPDSESPSFTLTDVKLEAFDGLSITERIDANSFSRSTSMEGGISITGQFRNNTPDELFIFETKVSDPVSSGSVSEADHDVYSWPRTRLEMKHAIYATNGNQVRGYIVAPGQTVDFTLTTTEIDAHSLETFSLKTRWRYVYLGSLQETTTNVSHTFVGDGSSLAWGEPSFNLRYPVAEYRPELLVPRSPN